MIGLNAIVTDDNSIEGYYTCFRKSKYRFKIQHYISFRRTYLMECL